MEKRSDEFQEGFRFALARLEAWGRSNWRFLPPPGRSAVAGAQVALRETARYMGIAVDEPVTKKKGSGHGG